MALILSINKHLAFVCADTPVRTEDCAHLGRPSHHNSRIVEMIYTQEMA